jgi:hypothetical protein
MNRHRMLKTYNVHVPRFHKAHTVPKIGTVDSVILETSSIAPTHSSRQQRTSRSKRRKLNHIGVPQSPLTCPSRRLLALAQHHPFIMHVVSLVATVAAMSGVISALPTNDAGRNETRTEQCCCCDLRVGYTICNAVPVADGCFCTAVVCPNGPPANDGDDGSCIDGRA